MPIKKRAISNRQKEKRRNAILDAALTLYEKTTYRNVKMAEVANKADMAKGTVFLYFKTKEELFIYLAIQEYEKWFDEIDNYFIGVKEKSRQCSSDDLMALFKKTIKADSVFIRLTAIMHTHLEHNISYEAALNLKTTIGNRLLKTGQIIENSVPFLKTGDGYKLLLKIYALIIGFKHLSEPAPIFHDIIKAGKMEMFEINFSKWFFNALELMLIGWKNSGPA